MFEIADIRRVLNLLEKISPGSVYIETEGTLRVRFGYDGIEYQIPSAALKKVGHQIRVVRHSTLEIQESKLSVVSEG